VLDTLEGGDPGFASNEENRYPNVFGLQDADPGAA